LGEILISSGLVGVVHRLYQPVLMTGRANTNLHARRAVVFKLDSPLVENYFFIIAVAT